MPEYMKTNSWATSGQAKDMFSLAPDMNTWGLFSGLSDALLMSLIGVCLGCELEYLGLSL